jgi:hypothetical protein
MSAEKHIVSTSDDIFPYKDDSYTNYYIDHKDLADRYKDKYFQVTSE